jgi:hypothetical protein
VVAAQPVAVAVVEADAVEHKAVVVQKDWEAVERTAVVAVNVLHAAPGEDLVAHTGPAVHVPDDAVTAVDVVAEDQQNDSDAAVVVAGTNEDAELAKMAGACCFQWEKVAAAAAAYAVAALGIA